MSDNVDDVNHEEEDTENLEQFTDGELEHFVTISCQRQRQAEADLKIMSEQYKDIIKAEKETRERLLYHIQTRRDAEKLAGTVADRTAQALVKNLTEQGAQLSVVKS